MDTERTNDPWEDDAADFGNREYDSATFPEDYDDEPLIYGDEDEGEGNPRRSQAATAMVLAGLFFIFSLVVLASFNVEGGAFGGAFAFWSLRTWVWIFLAVMIGFLVWLILLLVATPPRGEEDWYSDEAEPPTAEYADEPGGADTISLRCPKCVTIFTLQDPWTRPFYHVCPNCEARGVYTGEQDPPEVKDALAHRHGHGA